MDKMMRVLLAIPPEKVSAIDEWRRGQPDIPNRSEAIRRLVDLGLERGYLKDEKARKK